MFTFKTFITFPRFYTFSSFCGINDDPKLVETFKANEVTEFDSLFVSLSKLLQ